ncbi:MAG: DUF998 domain-containing protein [Thermoplasmatales archaeon]|nr:MAG: DUF998 domain-containing protein [Thermoplasmatales archaeon]
MKRNKNSEMKKINKNRQNKIIRITGLCGVMVPIVVFSSIGLAISQAPWFRWTQNALSDLGIDKPSANFFNMGMVLGGVLVLIFSLGLIKTMTNKTGPILLCLSSSALIGVGLFPETIYVPHFVTSATFFILLTLSLLVIGITSKGNKFERSMGTAAIFFVIFPINSTLLLALLDGMAIPEMLVFSPAFIWCMIYGVKIML